MTTTESTPNNRPSHVPYWLGAVLLGAIAIFFLWEEHKAHILGAIPYLLLLACPIIHLFMHRGHGHGHGHDHGGDASREREPNHSAHHHGGSP